MRSILHIYRDLEEREFLGAVSTKALQKAWDEYDGMEMVVDGRELSCEWNLVDELQSRGVEVVI